MSSYFRDRIVVVYPFIPLITKDGNEFSGFKFRSLDIRHYIPRYENTRKPRSRSLKDFFDGLLRQIRTQNCEYLVGLGYSIHKFDGSEDDKERVLNKVRNDVELLYFIFGQSNNAYDTAFPKFYVIGRVTRFEREDFLFSFELVENLERSTHYFVLKNPTEEDRNRTISLRMKSSHFVQEPSINESWKRRISKRLSERLYRGIFWANNVKDRERRVIEKIISSTIAVESILKIKKRKGEKWHEAFARVVIDELKSDITDISDEHLVRARQAFEQAANVRSGVVHGRKIYEHICSERHGLANDDIRLNFDDSRYYFVHDLLYEIFEISVNKKIFGDEITSGIRFKNLLAKIYPNKDKLNLVFNKIGGGAEIFKILKDLNGLKEHDTAGVNPQRLGVIIEFINDSSKKLLEKGIPYECVGRLRDLVRSEKGWSKIYEMSGAVEKWSINAPVLNSEKIAIYSSANGLVDFLHFLSNYIMDKAIKRNHRRSLLS